MDREDFVSFDIKCIQSPDEFYVAPHDPDPSKEKKKEETFLQFKDVLTAFYSQMENRVPVDFSTVKDKPYAAAQMAGDDTEDRLFHRCQVRNHHLPSRDNQRNVRGGQYFGASDIRQELKVDVFFIDTGKTELKKPATEVFLLDRQ